jgi:hypothetical protein
MKLNLMAVCLFAVPLIAADAPKNPMKPGKWEMTVQMDMPGMQMPARTFTKCITKEQVESSDSAVPGGRDDAKCKVSDVNVSGNTVTWKTNCPQRQTTGEGKVTYEGDAYKGEMHMKMPQSEMNIKYTGKRLGDCDASK